MSPETTAAPPTFEFVNLSVTKAIYELLAKSPQPGERPPIVNVGLEIGASAQIIKDGTGAFVKLETKITPDPLWQPYRIEVTLGAAFQAKRSTAEDLRAFCQFAAPSILFPYIRETVHRLTADAPHGPVRLNPMNISQLLNQSDWDMTEGVAPTDSTALSQPSEQSPSVSRD